MVAVNTLDGIKYGFQLLGYLLAVFLVGGFVVAIGATFEQDNTILAAVFALAGLAIIYAGALGTLYKVIGDGVEAGTIAAQRGGTPVGGRSGNNPAAGQSRQQTGGRGGQGGQRSQENRQGGQRGQRNRQGSQRHQGSRQGGQRGQSNRQGGDR